MGRNSSVGNVPAWFNLRDYDFLRDLGAAGWASIVSSLESISDLTRDAVLSWEREDDWTPETLGEIFTEIVRERSEYRSEYLTRRFKSEPEVFRFGGVSSLSNEVVSNMAATLAEIEGGKTAIRLAQARVHVERERKTRVPPYLMEWHANQRDFLETPFFKSVLQLEGKSLTENRAISVNMELPDDALIEDFKEWLAATRALALHNAAPKTYRSQDFDRWIDGNYVPLIILKKWSEVSGTPIAFHELASTLFPTRPEVTQEHIRKTHWPRAKAWATDETVNALSAQAAKEAGRNLPPKPPGF